MNRALLLSSILVFQSCSVKSDDVPAVSSKVAPEVEVKSRLEIKEKLNSLFESTAAIGKIQNVVQRGLKEQSIDTNQQGTSAAPLDLFEPSAADSLVFDENHPESFTYSLTNTSRLNLQTKSGGKLQLMLKGTLEDRAGKVKIKDAKMNAEFTSSYGEKQNFQILVESEVSESGKTSTSWILSLSELSALDRATTGENQLVTDLSGTLEIRISDSSTEVTAKDFSRTEGNTRVSFEVLHVKISHHPTKLLEANVSGQVSREDKQIGVFRVQKSSESEAGEFHLELNLNQ